MIAERNSMLQALEEAHTQVIIAAIEADARGVKGLWGPREILAHIVGWEVVAIECLPQLLPSEAPAPLTYDALNLAMVTLIGDQPIGVFRDMLYRVHERFLRMLEGQEDTSFVLGQPPYERTKAAIGHCLEHTQALKCM